MIMRHLAMIRRFRINLLLLLAVLLLLGLSVWRLGFFKPQRTGGVDGRLKATVATGQSFLKKCEFTVGYSQEEANTICHPEQTRQKSVCMVMCIDHLDQRDFRLTRLSALSATPLQIFIHPRKDRISESIISTGGWDVPGVDRALQALRALPGSALVDVGSNLGVLSLTAAKNGHRVVAIDANYLNLIRLRKSLLINQLDGLSEIYWNALAVEPGSLKLRLPEDCDFGSGRAEPSAGQLPGLEDPVEVRTAGLDTILLASALLRHVKRLVIRLDIEGAEWSALATAGVTFSQFNVPIVLMNWHCTQAYLPEKAKFILHFFSTRNYTPYTARLPVKVLEPPQQSTWPRDIMWIESDYKALLIDKV